MRDKLELGPVPGEESCEQVGPDMDTQRANEECKAYIALLKRTFGEPPEGASYGVTRQPQTYGDMREVVIRYDDAYPDAVEYAWNVEENAPGFWDDIAKAELGLA